MTCVISGDCLSYHSGAQFSAKDRDQDRLSDAHEPCAQQYDGGWWFAGCLICHLNGRYIPAGEPKSFAHGIVWSEWKDYTYSLKRAEMKIRPK